VCTAYAKSNRGRVRRKGDHVALGREDVHLAAVHLKAQRVEELPRILHFGLPVHELLDPTHVGVGAALGVDRVAAVLLVLPVRRDTVLSPPVHGERPDLHLDGLARRADHGRVQRLIQG
jgi:hypothetical protein